jgi:hypothetical protein
MSDNTTDPLAKSKWNFAAIVTVIILLSVNVIAGTAIFLKMITWQDWLAATGSINGLALGWVSKELTSVGL